MKNKQTPGAFGDIVIKHTIFLINAIHCVYLSMSVIKSMSVIDVSFHYVWKISINGYVTVKCFVLSYQQALIGFSCCYKKV